MTIVSLFALVVILIGVFQMADKEDKDVGIVYFGPSVVSGEQAYEIENAFEQVMSGDYNGDGKKTVQLITLNYMTDEQYAEKSEQAKKEDKFFSYDASSRNETVRQLNTLIGTGETVICLVDKSMYQTLKEQDAFAKLSDVTNSVPSYAIDEYGVMLSDTPFAKYYTAFDALDSDTVLCMCKISQNTYFMNEKAVTNAYGYHKKMLDDVFFFESSEEE